MSYSFVVSGATKNAVKDAVAAKMEAIAAVQACHLRDIKQACQAATMFIDLLEDDPSRDISVNMSGSLSGTWQGTDVTRITAAAVSVQAGLYPRVAP